MNVPYTYIIGWSKYNKFYYGRRTSNKCNPSDLWKTYFTSSKYVKEFRIKYGEPDIIQIRKTFATNEDCCKWESKLLKKIDAEKNNNFLNMKNGDYKWDRTGIKESSETRKRKSISHSGTNNINYGKPRCDVTKEKIRQKLKGRIGNNTGKKLGKQSLDTINKRIQKVSKEYVITDPKGNLLYIKNLNQFCKENNLIPSNMIEVSKKNRIQHKGWKCEKVQEIK